MMIGPGFKEVCFKLVLRVRAEHTGLSYVLISAKVFWLRQQVASGPLCLGTMKADALRAKVTGSNPVGCAIFPHRSK